MKEWQEKLHGSAETLAWGLKAKGAQVPNKLKGAPPSVTFARHPLNTYHEFTHTSEGPARVADLLAYVDDESYRRRILTQLNRGESRHGVARAVFHGQQGVVIRSSVNFCSIATHGPQYGNRWEGVASSRHDPSTLFIRQAMPALRIRPRSRSAGPGGPHADGWPATLVMPTAVVKYMAVSTMSWTNPPWDSSTVLLSETCDSSEKFAKDSAYLSDSDFTCLYMCCHLDMIAPTSACALSRNPFHEGGESWRRKKLVIT